jgi:hypothetical protein
MPIRLSGISIRVYGATTKRLYEIICANCEGKKKATSSLIDFMVEYDMIEPNNGKMHIKFGFFCYPKDHHLGDRRDSHS